MSDACGANTAVSRLRRATLAIAAVVTALIGLGLTPQTAAADTGFSAGAISMTVASVSPGSPAPSEHPRQLFVVLDITNNTGQDISNVTINAVRGVPIYHQSDLDAAVAHPKPPGDQLAAPMRRSKPIDIDKCDQLDCGEVVYHTTYGTGGDADLCQCARAIYPLYFAAVWTAPSGARVQLASVQTYLPSFLKQPVKARVGWLWPLLDRPHRGSNDNLFLDDGLAAEVAPGGRLDRLLSVAEQAGPTAPFTIVTDPNLIDELAVMSKGYSVKSPSGPIRRPPSADAARWLARLRQVLALPGMQISFTPYADPPVDAMHKAGLNWTMGLPTAQARVRVIQALGRPNLPSDVQWPAGETASGATLSAMAAHGAKVVVLDDKTLTKAAGDTPLPTALAPVRTGGGSITAAVTSTPIERAVRRVLAPTGAALQELPVLVARLALLVDNANPTAPYLVITPPRSALDVDPSVAARMIEATARTVWSQPVPLEQAVGSVQPVDHGPLHPQPSPQIGVRALDHIRYVLGASTGLGTLYKNPDLRASTTTGLRVGIARAESTSLLVQSGTREAARRLAHRVRSTRNQVVLVHPTTSAAYTLGSQNSRLPVTVTNRLPYVVSIVVSMSGAEGFSADPIHRQIPPNSTLQLRVPTHVDRVGLFYVQVNLATPAGLSLSSPLQLTVHSTALGTIGVVITIVAGVVLVAALAFRFVRRRRKPAAKAADREPEPATAT